MGCRTGPLLDGPSFEWKLSATATPTHRKPALKLEETLQAGHGLSCSSNTLSIAVQLPRPGYFRVELPRKGMWIASSNSRNGITQLQQFFPSRQSQEAAD